MHTICILYQQNLTNFEFYKKSKKLFLAGKKKTTGFGRLLSGQLHGRLYILKKFFSSFNRYYWYKWSKTKVNQFLKSLQSRHQLAQNAATLLQTTHTSCQKTHHWAWQFVYAYPQGKYSSNLDGIGP
jgi:hypothetical protein